MQGDPVGVLGDDLANLYRYVRNDPVAWTDPSGEIVVLPPLGAAAAVAVWAASHPDQVNRIAQFIAVNADKIVEGLTNAWNEFSGWLASNTDKVASGAGGGGADKLVEAIKEAAARLPTDAVGGGGHLPPPDAIVAGGGQWWDKLEHAIEEARKCDDCYEGACKLVDLYGSGATTPVSGLGEHWVALVDGKYIDTVPHWWRMLFDRYPRFAEFVQGSGIPDVLKRLSEGATFTEAEFKALEAALMAAHRAGAMRYGHSNGGPQWLRFWSVATCLDRALPWQLYSMQHAAKRTGTPAS